MNIKEAIEACRDKDAKPPPAEDSRPLTERPWWVIVINPNKQLPRAKFYFSYDNAVDAERVAKEQNEIAVQKAWTANNRRIVKAEESFLPPPTDEIKAFRYFAVERPKGGVL